MDRIDLKILAFLQRDGRKPFTEIAQVLGVSEGTVRNRVARLVEEKVIQIIGLVDPYQLGYDTPALIGISLKPSEVDNAVAHILAFQEVSYMVMVSGEFDLMVEVMCRNREHLAEFLNHQLGQVPGVLRTQTFLLLKTYKNTHGAQPLLELSKGAE